MTPPALTPAARGTTNRSQTDATARSSNARGGGHRKGLHRGAAPRAARRVSGPVAGAAAVALPAIAPRTAPVRPAKRRSASSRAGRRGAAGAARAPWRVRSAAYLRALPDHALLDRIIRGRAWIPLLGVLLVGIVAMQVEVLKLNAGIGRSLERASALQSQNELLRANVARLSDEQRIERIAAGMGMVMPSPDQMRFVRSGPTSVETALDSIKAPDATNFLAQLPTIGAPAAAQGTATNTGVGIAPVTTAGTTTGTAGTTTGTAGTSSTLATSASGTGTAASSAASTPTSTSTGMPASGTPTSGTPVTGTSGSPAGTAVTSPVTSVAAPTTTGSAGQTGGSSTGGATPVGG